MGIDLYFGKTRTAITDISYTKNGVRLVTKNEHRIKANKIVNATGYEVIQLIDKKIVKFHSTMLLLLSLICHKNPFRRRIP